MRHRFTARVPFLRNPQAVTPRRWYPGMTCSICGAEIRSYQRFNRDHTIPRAAGGPAGRKNKAPAHVLCNLVKGSRHPFSMRTADEREQVRVRVTPDTWRRLLRIWAGEAD